MLSRVPFCRYFPFSVPSRGYSWRAVNRGANNDNGLGGRRACFEVWAPPMSGHIFWALLPKRWALTPPLHPNPSCAPRRSSRFSEPGRWITQFSPARDVARCLWLRRAVTNRKRGSGSTIKWPREPGARNGSSWICWAASVLFRDRLFRRFGDCTFIPKNGTYGGGTSI